MPDYSVLMSVYEKEKPEYFRQSVESMARQTAPTDDFVIVCDGKLTDALYRVLRELKEQYRCIHVVEMPENKGLACALRTGLKHCRHEIVARMDSDDIAVPDRMERQLAAFDRYGADIISGTVLEFEGDITNIVTSRSLPTTAEEILKFSRRRNPFNHPCVAFRKQKVYEAGNYRECVWFEDYYLWLRMLGNGCKGYNLQEPVLYMRAGQDMYSRRGGFAYVTAALRFRTRVHREGYCGHLDYLMACGAHLLLGIIPNRLRILLYARFLRK